MPAAAPPLPTPPLNPDACPNRATHPKMIAIGVHDQCPQRPVGATAWRDPPAYLHTAGRQHYAHAGAKNLRFCGQSPPSPTSDDDRWNDRKSRANNSGDQRQGPQRREGIDAGAIRMFGLVEDAQMLAELVFRFRAGHIRCYDIRAPIARTNRNGQQQQARGCEGADEIVGKDACAHGSHQPGRSKTL